MRVGPQRESQKAQLRRELPCAEELIFRPLIALQKSPDVAIPFLDAVASARCVSSVGCRNSLVNSPRTVLLRSLGQRLLAIYDGEAPDART